MMRTAGELMRAYYRALDEPNLEALDDLFHEDAEWRFPGSSLRGPAAVRRSMQRSLSTGLRMEHKIGHMLEQGDVAICELVATNLVGGNSYTVHGAVVGEAQDGKIRRLMAYPDAAELPAFVAALSAAARR